MKIIKRTSLKIWTNSPKRLMLLLCSIHYVLKRKIDRNLINRENPDCINKRLKSIYRKAPLSAWHWCIGLYAFEGKSSTTMLLKFQVNITPKGCDQSDISNDLTRTA